MITTDGDEGTVMIKLEETESSQTPVGTATGETQFDGTTITVCGGVMKTFVGT